jgi:hypothetical protein
MDEVFRSDAQEREITLSDFLLQVSIWKDVHASPHARAHTHIGIYMFVCDSVLIVKQVNRSQNKAAMRDSKANKMPSIGKKK